MTKTIDATRKTITAILYATALSCTAPAITARAAENRETRIETETELKIHAEDGKFQIDIKLDPLACILALSMLKGEKRPAGKSAKKRKK